MKLQPNGKSYKSHIARSATGNPLTTDVNMIQSPEERKDKYHFCKEYGLPASLARKLRSWHWEKINIFIPAWIDAQKPRQLPTPLGG
jgi:hypothetical protein